MRRLLISLSLALALGGAAHADALSAVLRSQSNLSPEYRDLIQSMREKGIFLSVLGVGTGNLKD